jgi:hypothetical protein
MHTSARGKVVKINKQTGYVAIKTETDVDDSRFTVIELMGDYAVNLGDEISWPYAQALANSVYLDLESNEYMEVYVQNHWVTQHELNLDPRF